MAVGLNCEQNNIVSYSQSCIPRRNKASSNAIPVFLFNKWLDFIICVLKSVFLKPGGKVSIKCKIRQLPRDLFSLWQTELEDRDGPRLCWHLAVCFFSSVLASGSHEGRAWCASLNCDSVVPPPLWRRWPLLNSLAGVWTAPLSWDALSCARHQRELRGSQWTYFREIARNLNALYVSPQRRLFSVPSASRASEIKRIKVAEWQ